MSPDTGHLRGLTEVEVAGGVAIGDTLDDGHIVVSARVASLVSKGAKARQKARRRQANQSRNRNRRNA
jgi:hypothetical protein